MGNSPHSARHRRGPSPHGTQVLWNQRRATDDTVTSVSRGATSVARTGRLIDQRLHESLPERCFPPSVMETWDDGDRKKATLLAPHSRDREMTGEVMRYGQRGGHPPA